MEIREYRKEDEKGIRYLFSLCFGKELSHEEWVWKYRESPWGGSASIAVEGEEIVAHYGGLGMKFYFRGKTFDVYQPCDVMTHPKYRARIFSRKGAMVKAGEHFFGTNPMDFAFGFPSERHAVLGTRQLGYTEHHFVSVLRKKVSRPGSTWNPLLKIENGWDSINGMEIDDLWAKIRDHCRLSIEKTSCYIFWRYRDNPVSRYETLILRSRFNRTIKAFVVFSIRGSELLIFDFFAVPEVTTGVLFKIFDEMAFNHNLDSIMLWVNPKEEIFQTLLGYGYISGKGIPYIFKVMNSEITPAFLFENYCFRQGDYDAA